MTLIENLQLDMQSFLSDESGIAALLKRVFLFLEDGEFSQADAYCEKVLDVDPENALAYIGKLMASRRIMTLQDLTESQYTIDGESSYKKAVRFAFEEMKGHLHVLNMQIYDNCIAASRNRARIHLAHGELKETAQQYQTAMKLWEDSHETLPDADIIYHDLSNEIADFNWKLLLHNRQCPDNQQLMDRSIPIDADRWYLSAVKWADDDKTAEFEAVARVTLFNAHLKCMDAIKAKQTKVARLWAGHYEAAAPAGDLLVDIQNTLTETDGYTRFVAEAPAALLKLIDFYAADYPQRAEEHKEILQAYYQGIFQSTLDFTGLEACTPEMQPQLNEAAYEAEIIKKEAQAFASESEEIPEEIIPEEETVEDTYIDPVWATEIAWSITKQMTEAVSTGLSPIGLVSTYLIPAKELTIRYNKLDGIATEPVLFHFICKYYEEAIALAPEDQAASIQTKWNDFLIDTIRLPSATTEIVTKASVCMGGSNLPFQIYLARLTNNYSIEQEELIPTEVAEDLENWKRHLEAADPKKGCYWISDQQENIIAAFNAAENAAFECRQYATNLQDRLESLHREVLFAAGDAKDEIASGWDQKMDALQELCNEWAGATETDLAAARTVNEEKLVIAQKQIKIKEAIQLALSIAGNVLLLAAILALASPLLPLIKLGISAIQSADVAAAYNKALFLGINIGLPAVAGALTLFSGLAAPAYVTKNKQRLLWMYLVFGILTYVALGAAGSKYLLDPAVLRANIGKACLGAGALILLGAIRIMLEFFLCKLREYSRSGATQLTCKIGGIAAKIVGFVQAGICFATAALFLFSLFAHL